MTKDSQEKLVDSVFTYDEKDFIDDTVISYYDCEMRIDIFDIIKKGDVFGIISIAYEAGVMELYRHEEDEEAMFKLNFIPAFVRTTQETT